MSEIKATIALLCKFLKLLYGCNMKNEHFRLAKFNSSQESTVSHFWKLLYTICYSEKKFKIFGNENMVNFVKLNFAFLKYDSLQFYTLPTDMSSGSRELLLAFSWLLATQNILDKATKNQIIKSRISKEFNCLDVEKTSQDNRKMNVDPKSMQSVSNCILWHAGKLRHNLKAIEDLSEEWIHITTKIHDETRNICGLPHLSTGDAKLIYDSNNSSVGYEHLKDGALLIETSSNWLKNETVFWQWMETVVEEREKQTSESLDIEARHILLSFIRVIKKITETAINERKLNKSVSVSEELCTEDVETFNGVPRYIRQDTGETELEKLLLDSSRQIDQLKKECAVNFQNVKFLLINFQKKMNDITVLKL